MLDKSAALILYINPLSVLANNCIPSWEHDKLYIDPYKFILANSSHFGSSIYNSTKLPSPPPTTISFFVKGTIAVTPSAQIIFLKTILWFLTNIHTISPLVVPAYKYFSSFNEKAKHI
jgi:hypothetical protein